MFLIMLEYKVPISVIEEHLEDHVRFLEEQYELKHFIFSGRKIPRTGGVILANLSTRQEVDAIIANDPFYVNQLADYEIVEFQPTKFDREFSVFVNHSQ